MAHKLAVSRHEILRKHIKTKLDIEFLKKCKWSDVYPKFFRCKNVKQKPVGERSKLYNTNLNNAIRERNNNIRMLSLKLDELKAQSTTWM